MERGLLLKKNELIAYTQSFVSFFLERVDIPIKEIILFGSVARGDFDENSDIDLFIDILDKKDLVKLEKGSKLVEAKFYKSKTYELWEQKGMIQNINLKIGLLQEWDLKRSIISEGIVLYGKYKSKIKRENYILISFSPISKIAKRNRIIRELFGRNEKGYQKEGLVYSVKGKKISPTVFLIPAQFSEKIIEFLKKDKVDFKIIEIKSDTI